MKNNNKNLLITKFMASAAHATCAEQKAELSTQLFVPQNCPECRFQDSFASSDYEFDDTAQAIEKTRPKESAFFSFDNHKMPVFADGPALVSTTLLGMHATAVGGTYVFRPEFLMPVGAVTFFLQLAIGYGLFITENHFLEDKRIPDGISEQDWLLLKRTVASSPLQTSLPSYVECCLPQLLAGLSIAVGAAVLYSQHEQGTPQPKNLSHRRRPRV